MELIIPFAFVIIFVLYGMCSVNSDNRKTIEHLKKELNKKEIAENENIRALAEYKQKIWDDSRRECLESKRELEERFNIRLDELNREYQLKMSDAEKKFQESATICKERDVILRDAQNVLDNAKNEAEHIKQDVLMKKDVILEDAKNILNDAKREASVIKNEADKIKFDALRRNVVVAKEYKEKLNALERLRKEITYKVKDIPSLATYIADLEAQKVAISELHLFYKDKPAVKASEIVSQIKKERYDLVRKLKFAQYKALYYEQVVPWLVELDDEPLNTQVTNDNVYNKENTKEDAVGYWLTDNEYNSLSVAERNQRAFERYCKRNKTKLEIGLDFERFVGYTYEQRGYDVQYRGIIDGFEGMGRDLICSKGKEIKVIQCKCWSAKKVIHENHINQLFGTTLKFYLERNPHATFFDFVYALQLKEIVPILITSTQLSETAKQFAEALCVEVLENFKMGEYPMIKCNINRRTGEKIYHLPFDQQYDKVKIDGEGEMYVMSVQEAEEKGFRRAKRWVEH